MDGNIPKYLLVIPLFLILFPSVLLAQNSVRLDPTLITPHHYDVELTIDVDTKSFFVEETVLITVLQDTQELQINSDRLDGAWLKSRLVAVIGSKEFLPNFAYTRYDNSGEILFLMFDEVIPGNANYTMHFTEVKGQFGLGLIEVPLPDTEKFLISTGFENTNSRALFPCFDQPEFRTTFKFTVYHTEGGSLIVNGANKQVDGPLLGNGNNFMRVVFEIAEALPTSSIALLLTNMDIRTDNRVSVYHTNPVVRDILLRTYSQLFLAVEEELNSQNEFSKLDIVYAPALSSPSILVKWGIILVGDSVQPVENSSVHSVELKEIQKEIARSVYQLFFGQLINVQWWDERWIVNGLAHFFGGTSQHLPFNAEEEFLLDTVFFTIKDEECRWQWLLENVWSTNQINNPNVKIIYQKAGATVRVAANLMGEANFKESATAFLNSNRHSAITVDQFLAHLDLSAIEENLPAGRTLSSVMKGYEKHGTQLYPSTVDVTIYEDGYHLSRNVFVFSIDIPIDYLTSTQPAAGRAQRWIQDSDSVKTVGIQPRDKWILVNPGYYGPYCVSYENALWEELAKQLIADHSVLSSSQRGQLIADSSNLAIDDQGDFVQYFNLIKYLTNESDPFAWRVARESFEDVLISLRGLDEGQRLNRFYVNLAEKEYLRNRIEAQFADYETTMNVARIACAAGHPECVKDTEDYLNGTLISGVGLQGPRDFQYFVYCTLARHSKSQDQLFDNLLKSLIADRSISSVMNAIQGLGCSTDKDVVKQFLEIAGTNLLDELGIALSTAERLFIFHTFLRGSYEGTILSLQYILENFIAIEAQLSVLDQLFVGVGEFISTDEQLQVLRDISYAHTQRMDITVRSIVDNEILTGSMKTNHLKRIQDPINSWLKENVDLPGLGNSLKASSALVFLGLMAVFKLLNN